MIDLTYTIFNNELLLYLKSLGLLIILFLGFKFFSTIILKKLSHLANKTNINFDDILIDIVNSIKPSFYIYFSFYISTKLLELPLFLDKTLDTILLIWIVTQAMVAVQLLINYFAGKVMDTNDPGEKSAVDLLTKAAKFALWVIAILFILSNLNINITSFIAGLGIGGVAIAFALQNILSDLFSSFAIYFDKPFVVGDFVTFNDQSGTVEKIGIKTTRLKSLSGEEIVVSNKDLTSSVIKNFKRMKERRVVFSFGVTYDTSAKKLRKIPKIIENIIKEIEMAREDRIHFKEFGDFSLNFEVSFYVESSDYEDYMNIRQEINLKMVEAFKKEEIEFAFPTQTIYSK
ncbi:MAG: hypothetical protein PWQ56_249 [Patescibacteria group bacterium]|nr:hypothetical protein [Patescibacteria group bacterium]